MKKLIYILTVCCIGALSYAQTPKKQKIPVDIKAEGSNRYDPVTKTAYAEGNVIVRYGLDVIYADEISFDQQRREISCEGNVRIYAQGKIYRGEFLTYNLNTQAVQSETFRTAEDRIFAYGEKIKTPKEDHYIISRGGLTLENREDPSYTLKANTIEIYPDERVVLKDVSIHIGDIPVFWLPYVSIPTDGSQDSFDFTVGSSSRWGVYGLGSYTTAINGEWSTTLHGGYRSKRGFGGGVDVRYESGGVHFAELKSFLIDDRGTDIGLDADNRSVESEDRRYRVAYQQHLELGEDLFSSADINVWSDRNVTEDFFRDEFRRDVEPDNYLDLMYYDPNFTVTLLTRAQVNGLFNVSERKPELLLEFKRQKIWGTPISYEGETSMVNFERDFDRESGRASYNSVRYDTFHQFLYPRQYFGWLSLTPRAGARGTFYTRNNNLSSATPRGDEARLVLNTGLEGSFKVSRVWRDIQDPDWGIDGLRHVFQPFFNTSFVPEPNVENNDFRGFDDRIPSTRLQPLYYPAFNSIDSLDRNTAVRYGFRNKLQTKRDGANVDLIDWSIFTQANIEREFENGFIADSLFSHIYSELSLYPLPWLELDVYAAKGISGDAFDEVETELTWQLHPALEISFAHRYLDNVNYRRIPFVITDSNLFSFESFLRLNENWKVSQSLSFEADDGRIEEQRYSLYHDVRAWSMAVSGAVRENRNESDEFLVYLSLTLKAFPEANISVNN